MAISPTVDVDVDWVLDTGLILSNVLADLRYDGSRLNMVSGESFWIALSFNPAFDSSATVGADLNVFRWDNVSIVYKDSTKKLVFTAGSMVATTAALSFQHW